MPRSRFSTQTHTIKQQGRVSASPPIREQCLGLGLGFVPKLSLKKTRGIDHTRAPGHKHRSSLRSTPPVESNAPSEAEERNRSQTETKRNERKPSGRDTEAEEKERHGRPCPRPLALALVELGVRRERRPLNPPARRLLYVPAWAASIKIGIGIGGALAILVLALTPGTRTEPRRPAPLRPAYQNAHS
ncbi:hypothetical protein DFH09DRAFT_447614 [Mycena vulgaris]|nr:hypothetical protein DFH09DRAFT_447614 [Mycena vulgaris]